MSYADDKVKQMLFSNQGDVTEKINDPIWPVLELDRDIIHVNLMQVSGISDQSWRSYGDNKNFRL